MPQLYWRDDKRPLDINDLLRRKIPKAHWRARLSAIPDVCAYKKDLSLYTEALHKNILDGLGLLLTGDYGTGKSAAAVICLKAAAMHGCTGLFLWAPDIVELIIKDTAYNEDVSMLSRARLVDLLVIDDLGSEHRKGKDSFIVSEVERLVRYRIGERLSTIITTNLDIGQIEDIYGKSLVSILRETILPINLFGHDWRQNM